ncbi:hypothetical protein HDU91_007440 [Kappamyces sp. JEL0680]|nr:hypothetical protein HDU91_007440 [Kappamyces sp. JEL0680]
MIPPHFKNDMREKLKSISSEFADSDMLIDFVAVMVENQKPRDYVISQLLDQEAVAIADWLFEWVERNKPAPLPAPAPRRAFQMAMNQATTLSPGSNADANMGEGDRQRPGRKTDLRQKLRNGGDLRNLLSSGKASQRGQLSSPDSRVVQIDDRSGPVRKERHTERNAPYRTGKREGRSAPSRQPMAKCSYFPNCAKMDCPFFHPSEPCPDGESCTRGSACLFLHSQGDVPPAAMPNCKFGQHCTNPECVYSHPSPAAVLAMAKAAVSAQIPCRYYPGCLNPACPFLHPVAPATGPDEAAAPTPNDFGAPAPTGSDVSGAPQPNMAVCRFDPYCTRFGCYYQHPSRGQGSKNKVYVNPESSKTASRSFALADAQNVEAFVPSGMEVDS